MIRTTLGVAHSEAADPLHAMGLVYHQLGHYDKAIENIAAALKIVEREVREIVCIDCCVRCFDDSRPLSLERTTTRWECF